MTTKGFNDTPGTMSTDPGAGYPWSGFSVTGLEADIAYFSARLELIGDPHTVNQKAQVSTFRFLRQALEQTLARLKRKSSIDS